MKVSDLLCISLSEESSISLVDSSASEKWDWVDCVEPTVVEVVVLWVVLGMSSQLSPKSTSPSGLMKPDPKSRSRSTPSSSKSKPEDMMSRMDFKQGQLEWMNIFCVITFLMYNITPSKLIFLKWYAKTALKKNVLLHSTIITQL